MKDRGACARTERPCTESSALGCPPREALKGLHQPRRALSSPDARGRYSFTKARLSWSVDRAPLSLLAGGRANGLGSPGFRGGATSVVGFRGATVEGVFDIAKCTLLATSSRVAAKRFSCASVDVSSGP